MQNTSVNNIYSSSTLNDKDTIFVQVFNNQSCSNYFNKVWVTVTPLPTPTLVADKNTICAGDTVTFTAGGGTSYNFKVNGVSQQSGNSATYKTDQLANGDSVTVDVTNANKCTATSAKITMQVNAIPNGSMTSTSATSLPGRSGNVHCQRRKSLPVQSKRRNRTAV